jgi:hypothetical protein
MNHQGRCRESSGTSRSSGTESRSKLEVLVQQIVHRLSMVSGTSGTNGSSGSAGSSGVSGSSGSSGLTGISGVDHQD